MSHNVLYAQSGGVTAVINASACGVIETAQRHPEHFGKVFAARDGILGILREELYDLSLVSPSEIAALRYTPGGAFGSCRADLGEPDTHPEQYERLLDVIHAHDIGTFIYNGGGGSMLTAAKVARFARARNLDLTVIGVPKTIDNDLPMTDTSPGFGSAAKYIATSIREVARDLAAMSGTSTKVFVLEVMGRHAGWLAAASGLAFDTDDSPLLLLFPEQPFDPAGFLEALQSRVQQYGSCIVVAAEGLLCSDGTFCAQEQTSETFGHEQLGGMAPKIATMCRVLGYKTHWAVSDYFQRSARHLASRIDVDQAYACGAAAVTYVMAGQSDVMVSIQRLSDEPYLWSLGAVPLDDVADVELPVPPAYIRADGYGITDAARRYLQPLIQGEDLPPFRNGLPVFAQLNFELEVKRLPEWRGKPG
ncbi:6-phosphofructokinase [Halothiobacillus sp.]|uniref:6-phosphofructokinase n=1 Tax=Halothiobacillus sp. TaxID=1891311 RepID=UPI00262BA3E2|nr:6-phosphofructokinase [Halothiobacillus sp.]